MNKKKIKQPSALVQFGINFAIPLVILMRFSGEDQLGATWGFLVALAFPVGFELYNIYRRRKISAMSMIAIGGILITGLLSLLSLSEGWLAVRRSVPYLVMGVILLISLVMRYPVIDKLLGAMLDIVRINAVAHQKSVSKELERRIHRAGFALCGVLFVIALASYILTRMMIASSINTAAFNQEYAHLRMMSLAVVTVPLIVAVTGVIYYLTNSIEKLTGLDMEAFVKRV